MQDGLQQLTNRAVLFNCMTQVRITINQVMIATTFLHAFKNFSFFQFAYEPECGPFCYAHPVGNIAQPRVRVFGEADQHMSIVAKKRPIVRRFGHAQAPAEVHPKRNI